MTEKETTIRIINGDETSVIKIVGVFEIDLGGGSLRVNPYNANEHFSVTTDYDKSPVVTESGGNYLRVKITKRDDNPRSNKEV